MKPFNILPPRIDLVDKAGSVAREWWRWFNAIQEVTGGGASGSLADLAIQAEIQSPHGNDFDAAIADTNKLIQAPPPHGTDYDMAIADLRKRLETLPRGAGGSVAIKVEDLQALILSLPRPRDPQPVIDINVGRMNSEATKTLDPLLALRSAARSEWNGPYVGGIGDGVAVSAGTIQVAHQATQTVAAGTDTVAVAAGSSSVLVTLQLSTTLTVANGSYNGQQLLLELLQDGTGSRTVAFDSSVEFGTDIPSFTASTTINKRDLVQLVWNGSKWMFAAVAHGFA